MDGLAGIVAELISGGIGGNVASALLKNFSLGLLGNTLAGVLDGGLGGRS
ncbi:hypothetical protein [Nitrospira lenta]|nr:hypothetical protein [Nitrospira lenta]